MNQMIKTLGKAAATLAVIALTGCTMALSTERHDISQPLTNAERVEVNIADANVGTGTQAFVNASILAEIKTSVPGATLVAAGADLDISVNLLPAHMMGRWYTVLTLGALKQYYQLGTVRVVNGNTGDILAIHDILVKGRRVFPVELEEYRLVILPEVVNLVKSELARNGIAKGPLEIDLDTLEVASLP